MSMITMRRLGRMGRWGNQLFQYMFIRSYARRYGLDYQVSPWVGNTLFGLRDYPISVQLPRYYEKGSGVGGLKSDPGQCEAWTYPMLPDSREVIGMDYHGYAQFHTSYFRPEKDFLRALFTPTWEIVQRMTPAIQELSHKGTSIGLHLRRGDTGRAIFYLTPNEWYLHWLDKNWGRFHNPKLFIATEEPSDVEAFAKYQPITSKDLLPLSSCRYDIYNYLQCDLNTPTSESMDWFPDWYLLTYCNILLLGESTFGFSASMMHSYYLQECWRSSLSKQAFTLIDPWDAYPLVREHLDDYPSIPGTFYTTNPKWEGGEVVPT